MIKSYSTSWSSAQALPVSSRRSVRLVSGASTALITRDQFGGMAANDRPVPVRTLAQAARLIREARQLPLRDRAGQFTSTFAAVVTAQDAFTLRAGAVRLHARWPASETPPRASGRPTAGGS
jgi:hypothetical protein